MFESNIDLLDVAVVAAGILLASLLLYLDEDLD